MSVKSIKNVDFGRVDAEREDNLGDYFVETGVLDKISRGRKYVVLGRKGSGKTALFKLTTPAKLGHEVIALDYIDYPWEAHKLVQEAGMHAESAYVASWRFSFLAAVCRHWTETAPSDIKKTAKNLMKRIYRDEEPGVLELLIDKVKRIRKIEGPNIPGVAATGAIELDEKKEDGPILANTLGQWCIVLEDLIVKNYDQAPFTLKIDRLDDGWDASEPSKQLIIGVMKAARDLNIKLARTGDPPAVIVFLRSDIYNELRWNDKNKMTDDIEALEWTDAKLQEVAEARIAHSLGIPRRDAWFEVFSKDEMLRRSSTFNYIVRRTMGRPRDMIAFCLKCQDGAEGDVVQTGEVYRAEALYSRHIYNELDDEMHKQLPASRALLASLKALGKTRFKLEEWIKALQKTRPETNEAEARDQLKILFDYSIVGVPQKGGVQRGTRFVFNYNDRLVVPDFDSDMTVHPALKKELQLIEARRENSRSEADDDDEQDDAPEE